MGKERDQLIRRLGGVPVSHEDPSDDELIRACYGYYSDVGRLPPDISALRAKRGARE